MNGEINTVTCPNCGATRPRNLEICSNCGYRPAERCPRCGAALEPNTTRCPSCQALLTPPRSTTTAKVVWIVLFILVGAPAALIGGCAVLIGDSSSGGSGYLLFGLLSLALFVFLLIMLINSSRRAP